MRLSAQLPGFAPTPTPAVESPGDPYRRETPYGAFFGFMRAAAQENWGVAAEYLQWPKSAKTPPEEVAKELKAVLDERFSGDLEKLSRSPLGDGNDALGADFDRVGSVRQGDESFDVLLARTMPVEGPPVWLVSSQTLREVPAAFRDLTTPALDARMPAVLRRHVSDSLRLWQVLAFWLLVPVAWLFGRLLAAVFLGVLRRAATRHPSTEDFEGASGLFRGPLALLLAVPLHAAAVSRLGLPLLGRFSYGRAWRLVVVAAVAWILIRLIAFLTSRTARRLLASGASAATSVTIGRRVLQGGIVLAALLAGLGTLGVNLTATLAGLGIGGLAIAFAAQRSLENLFGGFMVLSDRIVRVGDVVRVGTFLGSVEDMTLYATRLRTPERILVSIPNGSLVTSQIENLSRRDKFLFRHVLGLKYETTAAQLQAALEACRAHLAADARVESTTARVRFVNLNAYTLDVEVFAYVLVPDFLAFLAVQEELLLTLMHAVEEAGSGFAFPTQTTYLASEAKVLEPGASPPTPSAPR
jgi:MscS family membrane protein